LRCKYIYIYIYIYKLHFSLEKIKLMRTVECGYYLLDF
jgi:hypothetical protein